MPRITREDLIRELDLSATISDDRHEYSCQGCTQDNRKCTNAIGEDTRKEMYNHHLPALVDALNRPQAGVVESALDKLVPSLLCLANHRDDRVQKDRLADLWAPKLIEIRHDMQNTNGQGNDNATHVHRGTQENPVSVPSSASGNSRTSVLDSTPPILRLRPAQSPSHHQTSTLRASDQVTDTFQRNRNEDTDGNYTQFSRFRNLSDPTDARRQQNHVNESRRPQSFTREATQPDISQPDLSQSILPQPASQPTNRATAPPTRSIPRSSTQSGQYRRSSAPLLPSPHSPPFHLQNLTPPGWHPPTPPQSARRPRSAHPSAQPSSSPVRPVPLSSPSPRADQPSTASSHPHRLRIYVDPRDRTPFGDEDYANHHDRATHSTGRRQHNIDRRLMVASHLESERRTDMLDSMVNILRIQDVKHGLLLDLGHGHGHHRSSMRRPYNRETNPYQTLNSPSPPPQKPCERCRRPNPTLSQRPSCPPQQVNVVPVDQPHLLRRSPESDPYREVPPARPVSRVGSDHHQYYHVRPGAQRDDTTTSSLGSDPRGTSRRQSLPVGRDNTSRRSHQPTVREV